MDRNGFNARRAIDVDELSSLVVPWTLEISQLTRGAFTAELRLPNGGAVLISPERWSQYVMNALPPAEAWQPHGERTRVVTRALKAYAAFATSADRGGFREL